MGFSSTQVTKKGDMELAWEHRFALRIPRPLFFGTILIAVCLSATYSSFQWFFDFSIETSAFGLIVFFVFILIAPAYFFDPYGDQHQEEQNVHTF